MSVFKFTTLAWSFAIALLFACPTSTYAQPNGYFYLEGVVGPLSIAGVEAFGGFNERFKHGGDLEVWHDKVIVQLNSVEGISQRDVMVTMIEPDGSVVWSVRYERPGQQLDPGGIATQPGLDYMAFVAFDINNNISYVVGLKSSGNVMWVEEVPDVLAKDIFWVEDVASGDPEFVVTGEHGNDTYVGHFEVTSGTATSEVDLINGSGNLNVGYCGTFHRFGGDRRYKIVTTNYQNSLYVHNFTEQGVYLNTVENRLDADRVVPLRVAPIEGTEQIAIVGAAEAYGVGTYYGFFAVADPIGDIQFTRYLSIGASGTLSSLEGVDWNPRTDEIHTAGYVTNPNTGNLNPFMINWDLSGNLVRWNRYFPTLTNPAFTSDMWGDVQAFENTDLLALGGHFRDPNVDPGLGVGGNDIFVTDDDGLNTCDQTGGSPWDAIDFKAVWGNFTTDPIQLSQSDGIAEYQIVLDPYLCGSFKQRNSAEAAMDDVRAQIFPQPALDRVTVQVSENALSGVQLFDMDGRLLKTLRPAGEQFSMEIDLSDLAAGMYLIRVENGDTVEQHRLVKQ